MLIIKRIKTTYFLNKYNFIFIFIFNLDKNYKVSTVPVNCSLFFILFDELSVSKD